MSTVSFNRIEKVYGQKVKVIHGISFEIQSGEFVVLVGPSGCGKSTLLRMLAGLEEISAGEISIDGQVINDLESKDRDIAMVFQSYALYPHMTVRENMGFALKHAGVAKAEVAAYEKDTGKKLEFTITIGADPETAKTAALVQTFLQQVGIKTNLQVIGDQTQYISQAIGKKFQAIFWRN